MFTINAFLLLHETKSALVVFFTWEKTIAIPGHKIFTTTFLSSFEVYVKYKHQKTHIYHASFIFSQHSVHCLKIQPETELVYITSFMACLL